MRVVLAEQAIRRGELIISGSGIQLISKCE
jgi:hypothetical protein